MIEKIINRLYSKIISLIVGGPEVKDLEKKVIRKETIFVDFNLSRVLKSMNYNWPTNYFYVTYSDLENNEECKLESINHLDRDNETIILYPAPTIIDAIEWIYKKYGIEINYKFGATSIYEIKDKSGNIIKVGHMIPEDTTISLTLLSGIREAVYEIIKKH